MAHNYTLKRLPAPLFAELKRAAERNGRSLNQELIQRLQTTCDLDYAAVDKLHDQWVKEAVESGPARPYQKRRHDRIIADMLKRAKARQAL